jgi:hypothetical protein
LKKLIFPLLILLSTSCKKTVHAWNELSDAERTEINNRAQQNCVATNAAAYEAFLDSSDETFASASFARGVGYERQYKLEGSTNAADTYTMKVWKQDSTNGVLYFYVTQSVSTGGEESYFLRIKRTDNEALINQLKSDHCGAVYTSMTTGETGPMSLVYDYNSPNGANTTYFTDTYTFNFTDLGFMGGLRLKRKLVVKDTAGTPQSTTIYDSTVAQKLFSFPTTDYTNVAYTQNFCELNYSTYALSANKLGFANLSCQTTVPAVPGDEWNLSI